ncbi:MAG: response regulator transcription factor [Lachnospiraceae bacterium]|nr:response regulator transcription factor [Lachnospiraceae bacterium]
MVIKDTILIVEDEDSICRFMTSVLKQNGYKALTAGSGEDAFWMIESHCPNLIVLDLGLPDMDGMDILKKLRGWSGVPVLVVSARTMEKDKVEALDAGADDYICKPFGTEEFLARVRTALRHARNAGGSEEIITRGTLTVRSLTIDYNGHRVLLDGKDVGLTMVEYRIVELLGRYSGKVLTYDFLMKELWGPRAGRNNQILRVNMANIRRKIEKNPARPDYLFTEVGVGYRLAAE